MRERNREERFEKPAQSVPRMGDLTGKLVGCSRPAVARCYSAQDMVVPVPSYRLCIPPPRARSRANGSSGSHIINLTMLDSPPRLNETRIVPQFLREGAGRCNTFMGMQMRRGWPLPKLGATAEKHVHMNTHIVPWVSQRNRGKPS